MKEVFKDLLILSGMLLLPLFIAFALSKLEYNSDKTIYNNNICTKCQTENCYNIINITKDRHGNETYYYECKNCHSVIHLHHEINYYQQ